MCTTHTGRSARQWPARHRAACHSVCGCSWASCQWPPITGRAARAHGTSSYIWHGAWLDLTSRLKFKLSACQWVRNVLAPLLPSPSPSRRSAPAGPGRRVAGDFDGAAGAGRGAPHPSPPGRARAGTQWPQWQWQPVHVHTRARAARVSHMGQFEGAPGLGSPTAGLRLQPKHGSVPPLHWQGPWARPMPGPKVGNTVSP